MQIIKIETEASQVVEESSAVSIAIQQLIKHLQEGKMKVTSNRNTHQLILSFIINVRMF
jgi:hypothetical protein